MDAEQAFWFCISNHIIESSNPPPIKVEVPSELPKVSLVNASLKKLKFHLTQFDSVVKKRTTPDALMNSMSLIGESVNMDKNRKESCDKCFNLEAVLLKSQNAFNDLLKRYSQLEKHCISLEASIQLNQEIFQKDESCDNQNALEIPEFLKNNDLKAQLQDKASTICKLKDIIKSMREKSKEENGNYDYGEIQTKNVELENSVAKLISENERLCNEINHVKQVFKEQFDLIKKTRVRTKEQSDSLIDKLNLKSTENEDLKAQIQDKVFVITSLKNDLRKVKEKDIVDIAAQIPSANTIVPGIFKLDLEPLAHKLLPNREAHIDYFKYTQEQADILRGIELLVYVRDTCPNAINLSATKVESLKTSDSNTPVLSSTGLKCSTSKKVNKKNRVVEPICDVDVKHSLLNANSEPICATCKKSMFDSVHDMCLLDFVENVNSRAKSAKKHKKQNIWKPTGHVFTEVGFKWKPTGRTFTIVSNLCPLTRITSANVVPPKKTTSHSVETQKPELKVYSKKPKNVKTVGLSKKAKIVESKNAKIVVQMFIYGISTRCIETVDRETALTHQTLLENF
ncbi:hypothetical protein Tco_0333039 [Tanacetum coccineum]